MRVSWTEATAARSSSAGTAMIEPYQTRFIRYLTDTKAAGFTDVTIAFFPYGPNSPQPWTTGANIDDWDPSLYAAD